MKKALFILLLLIGCGQKLKHKFVVKVYHGTGWNYGSSILYCDSATVISNYHAIAYVDGIKMELHSDQLITISTNQ